MENTQLQIIPSEAKSSAKELHDLLRINEKNWHKLKANRKRRAAELVSGALLQILEGGQTADIEKRLEMAILWIRNEVKPPSCPDRNR